VAGTKSRNGKVALAVLTLMAFGLLALPLSWFFRFWISEYSGPYHNTTALADFDGDGDLDVAVMNLRKESESTYWHVLTFWTNQGGGRFTSERIDLGPYLYLSLAATDLDLDGDDDFAILSVPNLVLYLNQGGDQGGQTGEFKIGQSITPQMHHHTPGSVVLGDLDGDGYPDAFVAGCCTMTMVRADGSGSAYSPALSWVWINGGAPGEGRRARALSHALLGDLRIRAAALGDLDGDGDLDVFAALLGPQLGERTGHPDMVLFNDGSGNFQDSGQRLGLADSSSVALGDLDGDGDLDALVGSDQGAQAWTNQGGLQGGRAGEFSPGQDFPGDRAAAVFLADFNGDGSLDALIAGETQGSLYWNDGQGAFTRSSQRFRYSERHGLAVGDFNGDGYPDIFAAQYSWTYRLWINNGQGIFR
jgi:hypothetical protein